MAFTCVLLVVIILMCQFPAEKPWLRPPNFLNRRPRWPQGSNPHNIPVTMEDLDVYFESLRSANLNRPEDPPLPLMPPPYVLASEPPPPYPDSPHVQRLQVPEDQNVDLMGANNNEDNNNGDINGNSDLRDQHSERVVAVLRPLSPPMASRRMMRRVGSSLVTLHPPPGSQNSNFQSSHASAMRESRSYAALISPTHQVHRAMMMQESSSSDSD